MPITLVRIYMKTKEGSKLHIGSYYEKRKTVGPLTRSVVIDKERRPPSLPPMQLRRPKLKI